MRPLTLKFAGLRSYRAEQEIDFADVNLMAVVGDTGAGKSSILEALCFALYGVCTWSGKGGKDLIADGGDGTLRVELVFRARGKTWRVTRTTSTGASPPPVNRLEGLSDSSTVTASKDVTEAIERLIGLKYKAFLRAVVLPQGRFQELLQASASERAGTLRTVLGLDQIVEVRRQAAELHNRLNLPLHELELRRKPLLADPVSALADAGERLKEENAQVKRLSELTSVIAQARQDAEKAAQLAGEYRAAANLLADKLPENLDEQYSRLVELDTSLAGSLTTVEEQLLAAEGAEAEVKALLAAAEETGTGISGVATALANFDTLGDQLRDVADLQDELSEETSAIEQARAELRDHRTGHSELVSKAQSTRVEADVAETAHTTAEKRLDECRTLLAEARRTTAAASTTADALPALKQVLSDRATDVTNAEQAVKDAAQELDHASKDLEARQRTNSAAHAAAESHAGDPCPICDRPLPDDFTAPTVTGTEQAKARRDKARQEAENARSELDKARESRTTAWVRLEGASKIAGEHGAERDSACAAASEVLGEGDLDQDDDTILTNVRRQVSSTAAFNETASAEAKAAQDAMAKDDAYLERTDEALTQREKTREKDLLALGTRREKIVTIYSSIPEPYRSDPEPTPETIESGVEKAKDRERELKEITGRLGTVQNSAKLLHEKKKSLTGERDRSVTKPMEQLNLLVQAIATRSAAAAELSGAPAPGARPEPSSITGDAQWAHDVLSAAGQIIEACLDEATTQDGVASAAQAHATTALESAGIADETALENDLTEAKLGVRGAERDRRTAIAQQPLCAELDSRISATKPTVESLREVDRLLADGKFLDAVVKRRQRALLGLASELLQSMTRDRFAFSDDFRIMDGHTGQPRDVRTLSGGETFLASLALALGLVELTSRGGGQVEALFLDEGFGSLDSAVLGDALEALSRQANDGRLVTVISHMRDVAENFDNVLLVTRSPGGSRAHWLDPEERDQLVTDELGAGLLT